jgi:hypothetical protein
MARLRLPSGSILEASYIVHVDVDPVPAVLAKAFMAQSNSLNR